VLYAQGPSWNIILSPNRTLSSCTELGTLMCCVFYLDVSGFMPYARLSDLLETPKIPSGKYRAKFH